ncbi:MAG: hypothetical protein LBT05_01830, partial [Planctomycetaceae bacterium]|nr:hypothetical protein [Planctomycetaceae bacterium]
MKKQGTDFWDEPKDDNYHQSQIELMVTPKNYFHISSIKKDAGNSDFQITSMYNDTHKFDDYLGMFGVLWGIFEVNSTNQKTIYIGDFFKKNNMDVVKKTDRGKIFLETAAVFQNQKMWIVFQDNDFCNPVEMGYSNSSKKLLPQQMSFIKCHISSVKLFNDIIIPDDFIIENAITGGTVDYYGQTLKTYGATWQRHIVLSNIAINSDLEFAIQSEIPNGTKVLMQDVPQLAFEWKDGKVVPITDEAILALRGQRFIPYPNEPRFWLMALGIAMIILSIVLKIR